MSATELPEIEAFFSRYPERSFDAGTVLARPKETFPGILYLVEGMVVQYDISKTGQRILVNTFMPGAFFPIALAINTIQNIYFFETQSPVTARIAPTADVLSFLKQSPGVTYNLLSRVYRGTEGLQRRLAHALGGSALSRLAYELQILHNRNRSSKQIEITHEDLSGLTGTTRETVSRTLQILKKRGLIEVGYRSITVVDPEGIEKLLGSEL